jgi:predicted PurR-regulated permease PerM
MTGKDIFKGTIIVLATLASAYVVLMSLRILVVVLVAIIIASAVRPMVLRLMRWRFSEGLAIVVVYLGLLLAIFALVALVIPPIVTSVTTNFQNEDRLANRIIFVQDWLITTIRNLTGSTITLADPAAIRTGVSNVITSIQAGLPTFLGDASSTAGEAILVFVMGVYWLTSHERAVEFSVQLFTLRTREKVQSIIYEIENMMGSYVRGIVFVATFIGFANFIVLFLLRIPNAGTLGFIIGIGTMLPIVGGFIGGGLSTLLTLLVGTPIQAVAVFATFVAVQQVETHYLTPRAMARSVGLDPILTIVAVLVGFTLGGVVGAIIATPVMGTIAVLLREIIIEPRKVTVSPYTKTEDGLILLNDTPVTATPAVVLTPASPNPPAAGIPAPVPAQPTAPNTGGQQSTASGILLP